MANLFLHNEVSSDKKSMIVGCLAQTSKDRNTLIKIYPIDNWEEKLHTELKWLKSPSHKAYWRNSDLEGQTEQNIIGGLTTIYDIVYKESIKNNEKKIPKIINFSVSDIKKALFEANKEEPTTLQLQLATNLVLMNISNYFNTNPEMVFDFPLYNAYISKYNLKKENYEVFDMISEIVNATQILSVGNE